MMPLLILKRLMPFLLVVAILLVPLHSVAHYITSGTAQGTCVCAADDSGQQSDQYPCDNSSDCCDSEECDQDATEPPIASVVEVNSSVNQMFSTDSHSHIPTVYLAIFVPPQR